MTAMALVGVLSATVGLAGLAGLVVPPRRGIAGHVRPYTIVAVTALGRSPDVTTLSPRASMPTDGTLRRLFGPPLVAAGRCLGAVVDRGGDAEVALRLRHAGVVIGVDAYRLRLLAGAASMGGAGAVLGSVVLRSASLSLALLACGCVGGVARVRGRLDRAIAERCDRMRLELYTVNQLLAMHLRTGSGTVQAIQRLVERGKGAIVEELGEVLAWIRNGLPEVEAYRRAAELTPEPCAARTYRLLASGTERGADLGGALLAMSEDLRDARREEIRKTATKRRAAMLIPTIALLAPIMLLFVAAPLPTIVFGSR